MAKIDETAPCRSRIQQGENKVTDQRSVHYQFPSPTRMITNIELLPNFLPCLFAGRSISEARRVFAFASHGLFNGPANARLAESALSEVRRRCHLFEKCT